MRVELKGVNQIEKFESVAMEIVSRLTIHEEVLGIIFLGALVRGFADRTSDLDITVFLRKRDEKLKIQIHNMASKVAEKSGVDDIDLMIEVLEDLETRDWDETDRWDYSKTVKIVHDPEDELKKVFREKLKVSEDFWIKRVVINAECLKWYCCPPNEDWVSKRSELGIPSTIAESWIDRGDLIAAHYCVNYSVDLLLKILFALNKEFLPPAKWRLFYSYKLGWLPKDYGGLLKEVMHTKDFSLKELNRRLKAIRTLWHRISIGIKDETGLTPRQMHEYYTNRIPHPPWCEDFS